MVTAHIFSGFGSRIIFPIHFSVAILQKLYNLEL